MRRRQHAGHDRDVRGQGQRHRGPRVREADAALRQRIERRRQPAAHRSARSVSIVMRTMSGRGAGGGWFGATRGEETRQEQ